jgi:hypothetical protein
MVQSESPIACPACGVSFAPSQLDKHLLQTHRSYPFRGHVRPVHETLAVLLAAVCSPQPDVEAWRAFETIATHECGDDVHAFLASSLSESLRRLPDEQQDSILPAVAALVAEHCICPGLVLQRLAASKDATARRLGWAIAACAPALLTDEILQGLLSGTHTGEALEYLRWLEQQIGPHPVIRDMREQREQNARMLCTRCNAGFRRPEMIQHLWSVHGLVLDGRRVREPWDVIDDWVRHYRVTHQAPLLERSRELAERADPQHGLPRVYRRFLAGGLHHSEARAYLLAEATEQHGSLCPHCYALVPMPEQMPPAALSLSHGRLSAGGYRVEICEKGLFPYLEIATPGSAVSRLPLPGPRLTPQGAMILFVGPLIAAALILAVLPISLGVNPVVPVLTFLLPAAAFAAWIRLGGRSELPLPDRVVGRAWSKLAPALHAEEFSLADSAFLAGLAVESIGRTGAVRRERIVQQVLTTTEKAAATHPEVLHHLAALRALAIADAVEAGADPVALTLAQVKRCFDGRFALPYADKLLSLGRREWRTRANLARLRVLLLDRAFEAGFEVRDLLSVGQSAPELGRILGTHDPSEMARLRLLWSLRPRRPWDRCGDAETAFGVAESASSGAILGKYPDLLLYRAGTSNGGRKRTAEQLEIILTGRGVWIGGKLFSEPVQTIEVRRGETNHILLIGEERFSVTGDPDETAAEIERWLRYYFLEFMPLVAEVYRWRSPHAASIVRAWGTVHCPECVKPLLARPGEVGIVLEAEE